MAEITIRTFIAVELDEHLRNAIAEIQSVYRRHAPTGSVKWVAPEGMHLTLKFLGDTRVGQVDAVRTALVAACAGITPFELVLAGRGCFPNMQRPRVVWLGIRDPGNSLSRLHAAIERYVAPLGWPTESRAFSPHLTLGRLAKDAGSQDAAQVGALVARSIVEHVGTQKVTSLDLIRSDLRPSGAVYRTLVSVPLSADEQGEV